MKENELKKEYILSAAQEIKNYLDYKYGVEVDLYDIAGLINQEIGCIFEICDQLMKEAQEDETVI